MWVAPPVAHWVTIEGKQIMVPEDRVIELTSKEDIAIVILRGGRPVD
jgi:hypothetical protein